MAEQDKLTITKAAIARLADCGDPRFKKVMTALITHLHDFVREVDLTEQEWIAAVEFLTDTGKMCSERRQEFIQSSHVTPYFSCPLPTNLLFLSLVVVVSLAHVTLTFVDVGRGDH